MFIDQNGLRQLIWILEIKMDLKSFMKWSDSD